MSETLRKRLENKLKLPVVAIEEGRLAVLENFVKKVEFLDASEGMALVDGRWENEMSELTLTSDTKQRIASLSNRTYRGRARRLNLKLYLCSCQLSEDAVIEAIKRIISAANNLSKMQIIIDFAPGLFPWEKVVDVIQALRGVDGPKIPKQIVVDGSFSCPSEATMDFLAQQDVILRYVLGAALGYSGNLGKQEKEALKTTSNYGLRVPVLFYWAGEDLLIVKEILEEALRLNRASGIGILPAFLSPHCDPKDLDGRIKAVSFDSVVSYLYSDSSLSEFLDEPLVDLEERVLDSDHMNRLCAVTDGGGQIRPFRAFPFTIQRNGDVVCDSKKSLELLSHPASVPMWSRCKKCAWKYVCGGIDTFSGVHERYHKALFDMWCQYRQTYLRKIISECIIIREHLSNQRDRRKKESSMVSILEKPHKEKFNPVANRMINPNSLPIGGDQIRNLDLDLTVDCNLDCDYCFKEKCKKHMLLETAKQAVIWLIMASGNVKKLTVALMGGEPMLRFHVIKKLVPFAKRRARQHGKKIHFTMTTNSTIINNEILEFWKKWGMGFHTSIDGCPEAHDYHRHFPGGKGSSDLLARNLPRILSVRPKTTARATVLPDTVKYLSESFEYFLKLGYQSFAFVPGAYFLWDQPSVNELESQYRAIMIRTIQLYRQGRYISVKYFDEGCQHLAKGDASMTDWSNCGAGRGMVLVDVNGDVWPCHRWNKESLSDWKFGSIWDSGFNYRARSMFFDAVYEKQKGLCQSCSANFMCRGGCPAENLEDTGYIWKRHPLGCEMTKRITGLVREFHDTLLGEKNGVFMQHYYPEPDEKRNLQNI